MTPTPESTPESAPTSASLWRLTGPDLRGTEPLPTLAQTLIAGAGLAGLAAALELARAGHQVVVVDADELGGRTTSRTTGKVSLLQGSTVAGVRERAGEDAAAAYLDANRAGAGWMRRELASVPGAWEDRTSYTYATTAEGVAALETEADAMAAAGSPVETVPARPAGGIGLPVAVDGALRMSDQAQVQPVIAAAALIARIREAGGVVVERCRVTGVSATGGGVTVMTERGEIAVERLILATGTPILDRSLLFATLVPQRQAVVAFRLRHDAHGSAPRGMYLSVDPVGRSIRTARDSDGSPAIVVGGGGIVTGRADGIGDLRDAILAWTAEHFPGARPITWWAAQDYRMTTHLPYAGAIRGGHDRVFAMTGFAKWGMTNAPAAALAVVGEITGDVPSWHRTLRDRRTGVRGLGIRDLGETAAANAEVGAHLVAGWVAPRSHSESGRAEIVRSGIRPVAESRVDGAVCRVSAVCPHLGGIVRWNDAESTWDCPLHGSRFTAEGGVIEGPATRDLAPADAD